MTKKLLEFLDAYRRIQSFITVLKEAGLGGKKPAAPMDYVSASE